MSPAIKGMLSFDGLGAAAMLNAEKQLFAPMGSTREPAAQRAIRTPLSPLTKERSGRNNLKETWLFVDAIPQGLNAEVALTLCRY